MSKYISLYGNSPTAGGTDGTALSEGGAQTAPLSVMLDATKAESTIIKCAIRCAAGYTTTGTTTITPIGTNAAEWTIAADAGDSTATPADAAGYSYHSSLSIDSDIAATNKIFWLKAASGTGEAPQRDVSVGLAVSATVNAV